MACSISDIDRFALRDIPNTAYYIPEFISELEEQGLLAQIYSAPKPKWIKLSERRLQNWGGHPHSKGMVPEPLPKWLLHYIDKIMTLHVFSDAPNHVLINEYTAGQGIMAHTDGPLYVPIVVNISLESDIIMDFYYPITDSTLDASLENRYAFSFLLERRSLLCLTNDMYENMLHEISARKIDKIRRICVKNIHLTSYSNDNSEWIEFQRSKRVSLTVRHFQKILKFKLQMFKNK